MTKQFKALWPAFGLLMLMSMMSMADGSFTRKWVIPVPDTTLNVSGFGNIITGVDLDKDGKLEIYAVNDNTNDAEGELVPRIYKYEQNSSGEWEVVWQATMFGMLQNTWPPLAVADLDKDGKEEIVWGIVNFLDASVSLNPWRIVVFEVKGDGSDVLGVEDTENPGNYIPNAATTIVDEDNVNCRPIKFAVADVDNDGTTELIFNDRAASSSGIHFGVMTVDDVPDDASGFENWYMEVSGKDLTMPDALNKYDMALVDNLLVLFSTDGGATIVKCNGDNDWEVMGKVSELFEGTGTYPMISAAVADVNGDGTKEVLISQYTTVTGVEGNVYLLTVSETEISSYQIADVTDSASVRLNGGEVGDIDQDGKIDYVVGTRSGNPNGAIFRVEYQGGDMTDGANWTSEMIDSDIVPGGQYSAISISNLDADPQLEVAYTSSYQAGSVTGLAPIVILDYQAGSADDYVVTFRLNTSTSGRRLSADSVITVRGGVAPLTWDDASVRMVNVNGDYWQAQVTFKKSDIPENGEIPFKFHDGDWEGGDNKIIKPTANMTTDLYYYNNGTTPPYNPTDSVEVFVRIFLKVGDMDPSAGHYAGVRGSKNEGGTQSAFGNLDNWATNFKLNQEGTEGMAQYFWSGALRFPAAEAPGTTIEYKFIYDKNGTVAWDDGANKTVVLTPNDTTIKWVYWKGIEPSFDVPDTFNITYEANMKTLVQGGWFQPATDSLFAPGSHNWGGHDVGNFMLQDLFESSKFTVTLENQIASKGTKYAVKFKASPDWKFVDHGWEGNANREWKYDGNKDTTLLFVPNLVGREPALKQDVSVTFSVDMNHAGRKDGDGNFKGFTNIDYVFVSGSWQDADSGMSFSSDYGSAANQCLDSILANDTVYYRLYDDGATGGDKVAGDKVYTTTITGKQGKSCGWLIKFGCFADGIVDTSFAEGTDQGDKHGFNFPDAAAAYTHAVVFNWVTKDPGVVNVIEQPKPGFNPKDFTLTQNYPNPFNPTTRFSFTVPEAGRVTIKIFNVLGQEVETVHDAWTNSGTYTVIWDGAKHASGLYMYNVRIGDKSQSKAMMLLK
ncbi:MAG: VCBS repeat-containing protein [Candidatus Delongbacteria bacterium]|nr:VCBS repeat-containing protein [Candidatus Delongbacteria bacterium]